MHIDFSPPNPITIDNLTDLAHMRHRFQQADGWREELVLTCNGEEYTVIIEGAENRWEMGLQLDEKGEPPRKGVLLEEGFEIFESLDAAIVSAILTVLEYYSAPPGQWRCIRAVQKLHD